MSIQVACDLGPARGATVAFADIDAPPVHVAIDADVDALLAEILARLLRLG